MDIFLICFVITLIAVSGIIFGIYKLMSGLLYKSEFKNKGMKILQIIIGVSVIAFVIMSLKIGMWLYENPRVTDPNYNREIYSVVIYNMTDITIDCVEVCVGDNRLLVQTVNDVQPREYRKINISTHESDFIDSIQPPYNVYIKVPHIIDTELCVGYFGIRTGGVELINIIQENENSIILEKENHSSKEYIRILRLHRKNQNLLNWHN